MNQILKVERFFLFCFVFVVVVVVVDDVLK